MNAPLTSPVSAAARQPPAGRQSRRRGLLVALGILGLFGILATRIVTLHLEHGEQLRGLAQKQRMVEEEILPRPGDLLDRQGRVLATSLETQSLFVAPRRMADKTLCARQLAGVLGLDPRTLAERFHSQAGKGFLWVQRRLSPEEVTAIRRLKLPAETWGFRTEYRRFHPQGVCAAQVLGQRTIDGVGQGGIEAVCDRRLRGEPGRRRLKLDARGRVLEVLPDPNRPVRQGENITLTLDVYIQLQAERVLDEVLAEWKPKSACAVVLDPHTGEVLAMASRPTWDPEHPEQAPPEAWTNRAIQDQYEPGSTFKPLIVAWGLDQGVIRRDEVLSCEHGEYRMGKRVLHDHHPYGDLSIAEILAKSSNIGMAKIGERLTNPRLHAITVAAGFGSKTGIELPGESPGRVWPLKRWTRYSTGSIPMGQELTATPLQIANSLALLANGGSLVTPHIVRPEEGEEARSTVRTQVIQKETADWLRQGPLVDVVAKGTGKKAAIPGYRVFGKTGTAQKVDPETGEYSRQLHVSSFVCGAPADHPRAVVIVSVDEPSVSVNGEHFGGSVAAPAAGRLLRKVLEYLRVAPEVSAGPGTNVAREPESAESPL
jgi:cell division protein FtsI/penicillin-binding protein 2